MPGSKRKADDFAATAYPPYCVNREGVVVINNGNTGVALSQRLYHGYRLVTLHISGKAKPRFVHGLVLTTFEGAPPAGCSCDHIDRNRTNNNLSNLRWATAQQQRDNSSRSGRPGGQRAVNVSDADGNVTCFGSVAAAMSALAPDRHVVSSGVYKALLLIPLKMSRMKP